MIEEIFKKYLEIKSINDLNEVQILSNNYLARGMEVFKSVIQKKEIA